MPGGCARLHAAIDPSNRTEVSCTRSEPYHGQSAASRHSTTQVMKHPMSAGGDTTHSAPWGPAGCPRVGRLLQTQCRGDVGVAWMQCYSRAAAVPASTHCPRCDTGARQRPLRRRPLHHPGATGLPRAASCTCGHVSEAPHTRLTASTSEKPHRAVVPWGAESIPNSRCDSGATLLEHRH